MKPLATAGAGKKTTAILLFLYMFLLDIVTGIARHREASRNTLYQARANSTMALCCQIYKEVTLF
jgi:hypothetical protein